MGQEITLLFGLDEMNIVKETFSRPQGGFLVFSYYQETDTILLEVFDEAINELYSETCKGYWYKREYDSDGNEIGYEDSTGYWAAMEYVNDRLISETNSKGYWARYEYDSDGNQTYFKDSGGNWARYEYDSDLKMIYYENSRGNIIRKSDET